MRIREFLCLSTIIALSACDSITTVDRVVGQLESDRVELSAEFSEPITALLVVEGQRVSKSAPIIQQNVERAEAKIIEGQAVVAQSQARLNELIRGPRKEQIVATQATVEGAKKELVFRRTEHQRIERLVERDLASPDLRDRAKAALDNAEASLEFNKARLDELLTGTTVEELDQARAAVNRAQAQLDQRQIDLNRHTAEAPVDGIVDSLLFEPGERPMPGQPMAILLTGRQPYARVYVPENLRVAVTPGTEARVFVDGVATPLEGRVRWVASEAAFTPYFALTEHDRGRLSYLAKIDIHVAGARLPDGVPVEVEFLTGTSDAP